MNVFKDTDMSNTNNVMSSRDQAVIFADAKQIGSLKKAVLQHAGDTGLKEFISHSVVPATGNTEEATMGPAARDIYKTPYLFNKPQNWVRSILDGVRNVPFARIRTRIMDITGEAARARGYLKGNYKEEQIVEMLSRETTPQTVYIKQRMHEDDLNDIVDFDMAALLKNELQIKADEEKARAILIGDGREITDPDKIKADKIRPIWTENELYVITKTTSNLSTLIDDVLAAKEEYRGGGNLTCFMNYGNLAKLMTKRDSLGHRLYKTEADLCAEMGVKRIVTPRLGFENVTSGDNQTGKCIIVDLDDYAVGAWNDNANKSFFEDFDIDYNQHTYLYESRFCGALVVPKSAINITITDAVLS